MIRELTTIGWLLTALLAAPVAVHAQAAQALIDQAARAMGGMRALHALKNEMIESEGKK